MTQPYERQELHQRLANGLFDVRQGRFLTGLARMENRISAVQEDLRFLPAAEYAVQLRSLATLLHSDFEDGSDNVRAQRHEDGTILVSRLYRTYPIPWTPFSQETWNLFAVEVREDNKVLASKDTDIGDLGMKDELKTGEHMVAEDERSILSIENYGPLLEIVPQHPDHIAPLTHMERLIDLMQSKLLVKAGAAKGVDDLTVNSRDGHILEVRPPSRMSFPEKSTAVLSPKRAKELLALFIETCRQHPDAMSGATLPLDDLPIPDHVRSPQQGELSLFQALSRNGLMSLRIRTILRAGITDFQLSPQFRMVRRQGRHEINFYTPVTV